MQHIQQLIRKSTSRSSAQGGASAAGKAADHIVHIQKLCRHPEAGKIESLVLVE